MNTIGTFYKIYVTFVLGNKAVFMLAKIKVPTTRNFFAYLFSLSHVKTNSDGRKISKILKLVFLGPKVHLFCLKGVPQTGNELAGDDVENCEKSHLTLTNLSRVL